MRLSRWVASALISRNEVIDLRSLKTVATIDVPEQAARIDFWKTEAPPPVALLVRGRYRFRGIALRQGKAHNFACGSGKAVGTNVFTFSSRLGAFEYASAKSFICSVPLWSASCS